MIAWPYLVVLAVIAFLAYATAPEPLVTTTRRHDFEVSPIFTVEDWPFRNVRCVVCGEARTISGFTDPTRIVDRCPGSVTERGRR